MTTAGQTGRTGRTGPAAGAEPARPGRLIADEVTTRALDALASSMTRSVLGVALLAVVDAVDAADPGSAVTVRPLPRVPGVQDGARTADRRVLRADRGAPFVARLLALDAALGGVRRPGAGATGLLLEPRRARGDEGSHPLELQAVPEGLLLSDPQGDLEPVVAEEARAYLAWLAAPGSSTRWTGAVPDRFTDVPGTAAPATVPEHLSEAWATRLDQEAGAATWLLVDWLRLGDLPPAGTDQETWLRRSGTAGSYRPLVSLWLDWLREREVLAPRRDQVAPGPLLATVAAGPGGAPPDADAPVRHLVATLDAHRDLVGRLLTGRAEVGELVGVDELRPARLVAAEPALGAVWEELGELVAARRRSDQAPLQVADVGGHLADNAPLRELLNGPGLRTTTVPAGGTALAHRTPEGGPGSFDVVLAVGVLHRWADPEHAVRAVADLLAPGGLLLAVENTRLRPLGLLLAGLLEGGFADAGGTWLATPVQDAATWLRLLAAAGLPATGTPVGPTPAVLLQAARSPVGEAARRAPEPGMAAAATIREGTQTEIARMWAELLPTAPRTSRDSFFELGGDSLRATRFVAALQERFGTTLAMRELFARPHLDAVAERVDAAAGDDMDEGVL